MFRVPRRYRDMERFSQILTALAKYEMSHFLEHTGLKKISMHTEKKAPSPVKVRKMLEDLGGTFVKLGQLLSLRPDLVPHEYCAELAKLQDEVEPFPAEEIEKIVREDLGVPISRAFQSFVLEPIASASIGQVHQAILPTGDRVAVKVQRPGVREKIHSDMDILVYIANLIQKHYRPESFSPVEIIGEFKDYTERELDYLKEAASIDRFARNFRGTKVRIPKLHWEMCAGRLIVMEFITGTELRRVIEGNTSRKKRKEIAEKITHAVFKQVFEDGLIHADPHPGNILVLQRGAIAFLDFGITARITPTMKRAVFSLFSSVISADSEGVARALVAMGMTGERTDIELLRQDLSDTLGRYYDTSLKDVKMAWLLRQAFDVARRDNIKVHRNLVLLGKSVMTLESVCAELYPDYNFVEVARPYLVHLAEEKGIRESVREMKKDARQLVEFLSEAPSMGWEAYSAVLEARERIDKMDKDIQGIASGLGLATGRIALVVMSAGLIIASSLAYEMEQPLLHGLPGYSIAGFAVSAFLFFLVMASLARESYKDSHGKKS